jgi:hypothetical protein
MRIDAWEDIRAQNAPPPQPNDWPVDYRPGYNPDEDPLYDVTYQPSYSADLKVASMTYWTGKTGQSSPPPPTFDHGQLGRYMDVYGCQAWMRHIRHFYLAERYALWGLIGLSLGLSWLTGPFGFAIAVLFALGALGLLAVLKLRCSRIYDRYYDAQLTILKTGEPVWIPFSATQLKAMRKNPGRTWP